MESRLVSPAPINSIPSEILATIFMLSRVYCVCDHGFQSHDLTITCIHWRQVALDTPNLWAHLDISPQTPLGAVQRSLERTKDCLLHVHVCEPLPGSEIKKFPAHELAQITALLISQIHRFQTLDLASSNSPRELTDAIFSPWFTYKTDVPRSLLVKHQSPDGTRSFLPLYSSSGNLEGDAEAITPLHLCRLHLQAISFDRCIASCNSLVDVQLELPLNPRGTMHVERLFAVLSANPMITVLKLKTITWNTSDFTPTALPTFKHLKILSLFNIPFNSLKVLLSLISLTAPGAEFAIVDFDPNEIRKELNDFFNRSRITTLYFHPQQHNTLAFWPQLSPLYPHMRTLILAGLDLNENATSSLDSIDATSSATVVFSSCNLTAQPLLHLLDTGDVSDLRLENCNTSGTAKVHMSLSRMRTMFLEAYPGLRCTLSDEDSTWKLACRVMFDT